MYVLRGGEVRPETDFIRGGVLWPPFALNAEVDGGVRGRTPPEDNDLHRNFSKSLRITQGKYTRNQNSAYPHENMTLLQPNWDLWLASLEMIHDGL